MMKTTKINLKELLKEVVHTDLADEFLVVKLEQLAKDKLEDLEDDYPLCEPLEDIPLVNACITLLRYYTVCSYEDLRIRSNKQSLKLEEYY